MEHDLRESGHAELDAMRAVFDALLPLTPRGRARVLAMLADYYDEKAERAQPDATDPARAEEEEENGE